MTYIAIAKQIDLHESGLEYYGENPIQWIQYAWTSATSSERLGMALSATGIVLGVVALIVG